MCPKGVFIPGSGRDPLNLMESHIRYAMKNSKSNSGAARFLNVHLVTYKKYAQMYIDEESGKNLYELHKNQAGKKIKKTNCGKNHGRPLDDILAGKYPNYPAYRLKQRLIRSAYIEEKCNLCGFEERRVNDYTVPLLLDFMDGDKTNHLLENIQLLCFNCYYLNVGTPWGKPKKELEY